MNQPTETKGFSTPSPAQIILSTRKGTGAGIRPVGKLVWGNPLPPPTLDESDSVQISVGMYEVDSEVGQG